MCTPEERVELAQLLRSYANGARGVTRMAPLPLATEATWLRRADEVLQLLHVQTEKREDQPGHEHDNGRATIATA
jgi:hypothetical protein